jgi:hypothetical protein
LDLKNVIFGLQEYHVGDPNDSQMVKKQTFLIRGGSEVPPGAPEASWTAYTAADCARPPGTLGATGTPQPRPPAPGRLLLTTVFN